MNKLIILTMSVVLCGCTVDAELSEESKNKNMVCTDSRDNEVFSFNSNTITNIRQGIGADSSVDIIDDTGGKRTLKSSMELYIKCKEAHGPNNEPL